MIGLDMSEPYAAETRRHLKRWSWVDVVVCNGEAMPFATGSRDLVTSIYMFHELPPKVRRIVFTEMARVLRPGGRMVIVDSLQRGDIADYDGLLELFPQNFHEPYYGSYLDEDFGKMAKAAGVTFVSAEPAFVSKVMVFDKA